MIKRPLIFTSFALIIGVSLGLFLIIAENYAARELLDLLGSEIEASGPFKFDYDSADMSFVTLKAHAKNARITQNGETKVLVPLLEANFSIWRIRQNIADLDELRLNNAKLDGIGADSAIVKVVSYLGAPLPPEKDTPDRFKIKLQKLTLTPSEATDKFGENYFKAEKLQILLKRTSTDNFDLSASSEHAALLSKDGKTPILPIASISNLKTEMFLADNYVDIKSFSTQFDGGSTSGNLHIDTSQGDQISGQFNVSANDKSFGVSSLLAASFETKSLLTGSLESPKIISSIAGSNITFLSELFGKQLHFSKLDASLQTENLDSVLFNSLNELVGNGENLSLSLEEPLRISQGRLSGIVNLKANSLDTSYGVFRNIGLKVNLADERGPRISIEAGTPEHFPVRKLNSSCNFLSESLSCSLSSENQELQATARLILGPDSRPLLESSQLKFSGSTEFLGDPAESAKLFDIEASASGFLSPTLLEASGKFNLSKLPVLEHLNGVISLKNGLLSVSAANLNNTLEIAIGKQLSEDGITQVKTKAKALSLDRAGTPQNERCSTSTFSGEFSFPSIDFALSNGEFLISDLTLGCSPYALKLAKPQELKVNDGNLSLSNFNFLSPSGDLNIDGKISIESGYDLKATGQAELSALLPFAKELDELSGQLLLDMKILGPLAKPKISGQADLTNTTVEIESPQLQIRKAQGHAVLEDRAINLSNFNGSINGGDFSVEGAINLDSIALSDLHLKFEKVALNPIAEAEFISSGQLDLSKLAQQEPTLSGTIEIENAQIEKRFDFLKLASDLSKQLIGAAAPKDPIAVAPQASPVKLDLKISAPSSLYFDSNFAQAEARADLVVSGPVYNPIISGEVELLEGWFGLRDRRFDIGSGKLIFSPDSPDPRLEILAETSVFSRQGESVVIFAAISGPVTAPRVKLDSDRGYTEREILQLLTTSSDVINNNNRMGMFSQDLNLDVPFVSDDSFFGLGRWLRRLTKIDSLSIEPSFNSQRGVIEPTLIAEKNIWPNLILRGETSFGSSNYDAKLRLNYSLSPRLTVSGIVDALAAQENTALGFDVSYAIRPQRSILLQTRVSGNIYISTESILSNLKLNEDSRVMLTTLPRLKESLQSFYNDSGFPYARLELSCEENPALGRCRKLNIVITEGDRLVISRVENEGDPLPKEIAAWLESQSTDGQTATRAFKDQIVQELIRRLRNEGFIRARITSDYLSESNPTTLKIFTQIGKAVTFVFIGNETFSNEDLLASINLFGRKQPFGNNTINLLTTNIERLYNQNGFPYTAISWAIVSKDEAERTIYNISINEGERLSLNEVKFEGLVKLSEHDLKEQIKNSAPESLRSIFNPPQILAELIEENCRILEATLVFNGFDNANVHYRISEDLENSSADVIYEIIEGQQNNFEELEVTGMPEGITFEPPVKPFSNAKITTASEDLLRTLNSAGYRSAKVSKEENNQSKSANLRIIAGPLTTIGNIYYEGLEEISQSVLESKLRVKHGDAWDEEAIAKSRQAILRSGLFKKVEFKPKDGQLDNQIEDVIISLEQRNLQSIQIGTGLNSEYGLHIFGSVTDREFFADGRSISARVDTYFDDLKGQISQGVMSLNYADPEFMNNDTGFVSDLRFQRLDQTSMEFNLDRVSHAAYLHKNFDENISGSFGHTILVENLDNVSPGAVLDPDLDTGTVHIGYLQANSLFDYRDSPLNPRSGQAFAINPQIAGKALGSEANFAGINLRASKIIPFYGTFERFSLAYNGHAASSWTYAGTDFVPISQRYYTGGRTSVRGFRENSLGPKAEDGAVIGGDQLIVQSLEFRYLVAEDTSLNIFLDSGKLSLRDYNAEGEDMRYSTGVGIRYLSPIGPIGFDVGFPLDEKSGEPSTRFHFNLGANF